jgi:hypothetical protein
MALLVQQNVGNKLLAHFLLKKNKHIALLCIPLSVCAFKPVRDYSVLSQMQTNILTDAPMNSFIHFSCILKLKSLAIPFARYCRKA